MNKEVRRLLLSMAIVALLAVSLCITGWAASQPARVYVYEISQPVGIR